MAVLAALLGAVVLPLALTLLRNRPRDLGLQPYGAGRALSDTAADSRSTPLGAAVRTGDFWLIALSYGVCGFTTMGLVGTHFIPHAVEHGFSETQAAGILSLMGGLNLIGTTTSGWLCDRVAPRKLLAGYFLLRAGALALLPFVSSVPLMSLFAITFGLDYIATVPPTIMLTAERFGRRSLGGIFGWITCVHMVGAALAAAVAGRIHDAVGDYTVAIYLSGMLALLAAALAFSVRPRRARRPSRRWPRPATNTAGRTVRQVHAGRPSRRRPRPASSGARRPASARPRSPGRRTGRRTCAPRRCAAGPGRVRPPGAGGRRVARPGPVCGRSSYIRPRHVLDSP
ncbi:MAG: MFS transporter [Dehalococcoidia bacterium]